jgi:hypothetical protein
MAAVSAPALPGRRGPRRSKRGEGEGGGMAQEHPTSGLLLEVEKLAGAVDRGADGAAADNDGNDG